MTKLTHPAEHLDPKRQINLLEQSGLSDAIEANLANQSQCTDGSRGSAKLHGTRNLMMSALKDRKLKTMPAWKKSRLSHGSRYADSGRNAGEEYDNNGHLIKSSKMFDSQEDDS